MPRTSLEIPIVCRQRPERSAECAECVRQRLVQRPGIRSITVYPSGDKARLELDYDADLLTLAEVERDVLRQGECLAPEWGHAVLPIEGMVSTQSEQLIEAALRRLPGLTATASFASQLVRIEFDPRRCQVPDVVRVLGRLGFRVRDGAVERWSRSAESPRPKGMAAVRERGAWARLMALRELLLPIVGGVLLAGAYAIHAANGPQPLRAFLLGLSLLFSARYTGPQTWHAFRYFRFDIDVLMYVAAAGAIVLGHYEEAALLLVLFGIGTAGENLAMDKARHAIRALAELAPETAIRIESDGAEREVRIEDLGIGDRLVVRPYERIALDGAVESGASAVDESALTGESVPVEKAAASLLYAGTMNGGGRLVMRASRLAGETRLAKIVQLVSEAQTTKSPTQLLTDRVERWYVPGVLVATTLLIFLPPLIGGGAWSVWFYRAMAFLTAASPCALAIGTPAAVLSGIARAARGGVLIKGGVHLENLSRVRVVAFDKTGTLTRGRAEVSAVVALNGADESDVLRLAAGVERGSQHPLAAAIVVEARVRGLDLPDAADVREMPGEGVVGEVAGRRIRVGRLRAEPSDGGSEVHSRAATLQEAGNTTVLVTADDQPIGLIALSDHPREQAAGTLARIRRLGVRRTVMLTGDNERVARAIAAQVGVDEYHAGLMPEDKLGILRRLANEHGTFAMVGDGTNDAPALAAATVGIAMGGAGTDVALETADVALMADDLAKLPEALGLSRFSRRIILQNLVIALGVIAVLAPIAALGGASLGLAVVCHEGSTVVVVLNALRLLVYKMRD